MSTSEISSLESELAQNKSGFYVFARMLSQQNVLDLLFQRGSLFNQKQNFGTSDIQWIIQLCIDMIQYLLKAHLGPSDIWKKLIGMSTIH